ncbi:hypothetical protein BDN70DRAFT_870720 [Pholiota conissans]|uniref:Uncharacterized protein n=1 Tax=Pholiota conissans TaxID=109636 RepID=A0A9P6D7H8_9AGAR|nr:hypothetical protein BDN70DRAFT_870720 [Pholiota conissans]
MPPLARPSRPRLWALLLTALAISVLYDVEVKRNLKLVYEFTLYRPINRDAPPDYTEMREWESRLPQHDTELPFPEGKTGRYVLFANSRAHQAGWNNKLNEMLFNTWLAHDSNRAYVFHDFIWEKTHYPWRTPANASNPLTPLTALVAGPSAGAPWDAGDSAPRAVTEVYFDLVCPKHTRRVINTRDVKPRLRHADGSVIFDAWRRLLSEAPERCIEIEAATPEEDAFPETFDIYFWSGRRSVSLWDAFKDAPVSRLLRTSPTVQAAVDANAHLFQPARPHTNTRANPLESVFSIHVRRGDFKQACLEHAALNSTFYNWNLLPFLPDKFDPPPPPPGITLLKGTNTPENEAAFLARCLPFPEAIAHKVREARREYREHTGHRLDVLYIMSNDGTTWLDALKETLRADGWNRIVTSRDLRLTAQQKDVGVAVDMDIGRQSAVFIGNGWSSFTSNVVHRRLIDGKEPISIRFW